MDMKKKFKAKNFNDLVKNIGKKPAGVLNEDSLVKLGKARDITPEEKKAKTLQDDLINMLKE